MRHNAAMTFQDHFSAHAGEYAAHRPTYPDELFVFLAEMTPARELAWDVGAGSGQAAVALARFFDRVVATDASAEQITQAKNHAGVEYRVAPAERSPLADGAVDLVTVAQALHWFDREPFFTEARRVLKPGGALAAWCYGLHRVTPEVDAVIGYLYDEVLAGFWPAERALVDGGYATIEFPLERLETPEFEMAHQWTLVELMAYISTWSAAKRYETAHGKSASALIIKELCTAWGNAERSRQVTWPLYLHARRKK